MRVDIAAIRAISQIADRNSMIYEAAKYYASQGLPVIPIPAGEKMANSKTIYTNRCSIRAEKIEGWFNPIRGTCRGFNIAIGCGDYYGKGGIFAVDIDTKYKSKYGSEPWGPEAWDQLVAENGEIYGPIQETPSGGRHHLTLWAMNLTPSQDKIALGIDTRGGHEGKISSHIMVWPSVVNGIEYKWIEGGEITHAPAWIMERMGRAWKQRATGTGRGSENVDSDDTEDFVSLPKVRAYLFTIDPDDLTYEEWVRVGQAIQSQHNTKEGLDLWDEWSQQGERYEEGECHIRWKGFDSAGPVRMATLIYIAQNRGTASKMDIDDGGSEEGVLVDVIDEYNDKYALVLTGENAKVIRKEANIDTSQTEYRHYKIDALRAFLTNDVIVVDNGDGPPKKIRKFDLWMASTRRRTFDGLLMRPDKPKVIEIGIHQYLNTWAGFAVQPLAGSWELLKAHTKNFLCRGDEGHYEWLMDWMADMFQNPADPKGTAVILGGIEGAGKGTLANAIAHIFGIHGTIISNSKHLTSQFNAMIMDSVFLFADEVIYAGDHDAANRLKAMVTEKTNTREQKFGDQKQVRSFLHIMMSTNNEWKVAAGPESRRYFILQVSSDVANDEAYFGAIKKELNNGGYQAMLHELLNRKITHNLRWAPVTEELKKQRAMLQVQSLYESFPAWIAYMCDTENLGAVDAEMDMEKGADTWPKIVEKSAIYDAYAEWSKKFKPRATILSTVLFFPKLHEMGFSEGPRIRVGNSRARTLNVPPFENFCYRAEKIHAIMINQQDEEGEDE